MESLLRELFIIALLSTIITYACHKIKIPSIVGFLLTGAVFGPSALGLVRDAESVHILSEVGIVFLLFSIGMELSISELMRLKKPVFLGGTLQVGLTIALFFGLAMWLWPESGMSSAVFIGFLVALSSTAIVLKALQQKGMMESPGGRISVALLIFQDIIIVPMMLAVPLLAGKSSEDFTTLSITAVKTLSIIAVVFFVARKAVPWLLKNIIAIKSREVFIITTIGICLGIAYLTSVLGLSVSLGAFIAGLIVAESDYSFSALDGILPFRDVFTSIFFISVGMLLDVQFFFSHIEIVLLATVCVLVFKALIAGGDALIMGYPLRPAIIVGLAVCQLGEFSFVLAKVGLNEGLLDTTKYQIFLATSILTMVVAPFLVNSSKKIAQSVANAVRSGDADSDADEENTSGLSDHLIIIGYGIGGQMLSRAARMAGIPYVILEMNPDTVRHYKKLGEPIMYGDATHGALLMHLGLSHARVLCVVISDSAAVRSVTEIAHVLAPHVYIYVRTRFLREVLPLKELGANSVIPEEFETSIEMFTRVLGSYLVPQDAIRDFTNEIREETYDVLRKKDLVGVPAGALLRQLPDLAVFAYTLHKGTSLEGKTLQETNLRQKENITVVAIKRGDETFSHPQSDFTLQAEDIVYILGAPKAGALAAKLFAAPAM